MNKTLKGRVDELNRLADEKLAEAMTSRPHWPSPMKELSEAEEYRRQAAELEQRARQL